MTLLLHLHPRMISATDRPALPGIARRIAVAVYDGLLVLAVMFAAAFPFILILGGATEAPLRHVFQAYLFCVLAAYFVWFWTHGGQTLAMKTWRVRLVVIPRGDVSTVTAISRFVLACAGLAFFGAGWWWMLFDREGLTLHDRLTGTRLIKIE